DGTAHVWNARNGRELVTLSGHRDSVSDASFSRGGLLVVTASDDGTARIWDTGLENQLGLVGRTRGRVVRVGFDGARMFAAAQGGIDVWRTAGHEPAASLPARAAVD